MRNSKATHHAKQKPSQLIGRYFLGSIPGSIPGGGKWMGYVRSAEADGYFYLDQYDWLLGAYSNSTLVHIRDMAGWTFLNDKDDLFHEANLHMRRQEAQS
jgi:hypothetical protein